jgi:quinoprotein dehydrogenase-associated probable ABC transporter substrate-binding protein
MLKRRAKAAERAAERDREGRGIRVRIRPAGVRTAAIALLIGLGSPPRASAQQVPDLVTPDALRVCADPANLPFTNRKGEGFENRIAEIIGDELKIPVRYYWLPQGPGFVRNTLGLKLCDVIIGYAAGTDIVQHSNPYYRSVYSVLVMRQGPLSGLKQLSDPRLKNRPIGIVAATPPVDHLTELHLAGQARTYSLLVDRRYESPADEMVADLLAGRIDAAILWGPTAGYLAKRHDELELVPLLHEAERPPLAYRITLGLRPNEIEWKRTLNTVLRRREADIVKVLLDDGVPLLDDEGNLLAKDGSKP